MSGVGVDLLGYAIRMAEAGVSVGPANVSQKRPTTSGWKDRQKNRYQEPQLKEVFKDKKADGVCIFTGKVSGSLEMIDFDCRAVDYQEWYNRVDEAMPGLVSDLVIERSQSGGRHVVYRANNMAGNQKLCVRVIPCEDTETHEFRGKPYPVKSHADGRYSIEPCTIETRGEGGLFLCYPSPGYRLEQGSLTDIKLVSEEERNVMIGVAREMSDTKTEAAPTKPVKPAAVAVSDIFSTRPGDDFNKHGDIRELLRQHGWTLAKGGANEYWRRPGKGNGQHSATLKDGVFYVFSSNAAPFDAGESYSQFAVYSMLEHGGDFGAAATDLGAQNALMSVDRDPDVDLDGIMGQFNEPEEQAEEVVEKAVASVRVEYDPTTVAVSKDRLRAEVARRKGKKKYDLGKWDMPGLGGQMMRCILDASVYPNPAIAFGGVITMIGTLAGRKYRDEDDNRTNLYVVTVAESSQGKESTRTFNAKLAEGIDAHGIVMRKFSSAEGIEDKLVQHPSCLYQVDEIQSIFEAMKNPRDPRYGGIMVQIMELFSSAGKMFIGRSKAGDAPSVEIDQPCMSIYGSSTPMSFYGSLSTAMLTSGLFGRFLIIEADHCSRGYEPGIMNIPEELIEQCSALWSYSPETPGIGNRGRVADIVTTTQCGLDAKVEAMLYAEDQLEIGRKNANPATVIWGKSVENIRKLALIYAISRDWEDPKIDNEAVIFARDIIFDANHKMVERALSAINDSDEQKQISDVRDIIQKSGKTGISQRDLSRRSKLKVRNLQEILVTLKAQEFIDVVDSKTQKGRPTKMYRFTK